MVDYSSPSLDTSLYALSDPTRREMLVRLTHSDITVSELAAPFSMSLAAVSKHLRVLERAHLITKSKMGRTITCRATLTPLREVHALLEDLGRYWNFQLDSLENYLVTDKQNKEQNEPKKKRNAPYPRNQTNSSRKKK